MTNEQTRGLTPEELEQQSARALPDREEMSVINPSAGMLPPTVDGPFQPATDAPVRGPGGILPPTVEGDSQPA